MYEFQIDDSVMIYNDGLIYYGTITAIDYTSNYPYEITLSGGSRNWFKEDELVELIDRP